MNIAIVAVDFSGPDEYSSLSQPSWPEVETFVLSNLLESPGRVEIELAGNIDISIRSDGGLYLVLVDCIGRLRKLLQSNASIANPEENVSMDDGESLRKDVIDDLPFALNMIGHYVRSGEFLESADMSWRDA